MFNNTISETGVVFFSAGGHSHDGVNSSIIDTTKYSIFDFNVGQLYTTRNRQRIQQKNELSLRSYIIDIVNTSVLEPAGIVLQDNIINSRNIIAGSITSEEIAANTITANNIAVGTITGNLIAANTITGSLIQANTINGNSIVAGSITADRLAANAISANSITVGPNDFWAANGFFRLGGTTGIAYNGAGNITIGASVNVSGDISGASGTFSGAISATSGSIAGWTILPGSLSGGGTFLYSNGTISANVFRTAASGARIEMGPGVTTADEIFFYDSGGTRSTIRNPGSGEFRISTPGGTYTFGSQMVTASNLQVGSISAHSTNLTISAPSGFLRITTQSGASTYNAFITGTVIQNGYFWSDQGSISFPSFSFVTDTDTGMYLSGTNEVRLSSGGGWGLGVQSGVPIVNVASGTGTTLVVDANARIRSFSSKTELKDNILPINNALETVKLLQVKTFTFKPFDYDTPKEAEIRQLNTQIGFLAEQVAEVSEIIGIDLHESQPNLTVNLESFFSSINIQDPVLYTQEVERIKNSDEYQQALLQYEAEMSDLDSYVPSYWKHPHMIALAIAAIKELSDKIDLLESRIQGE